LPERPVGRVDQQGTAKIVGEQHSGRGALVRQSGEELGALGRHRLEEVLCRHVGSSFQVLDGGGDGACETLQPPPLTEQAAMMVAKGFGGIVFGVGHAADRRQVQAQFAKQQDLL
jgi:hypothetical protein